MNSPDSIRARAAEGESHQGHEEDEECDAEGSCGPDEGGRGGVLKVVMEAVPAGVADEARPIGASGEHLDLLYRRMLLHVAAREAATEAVPENDGPEQTASAGLELHVEDGISARAAQVWEDQRRDYERQDQREQGEAAALRCEASL